MHLTALVDEHMHFPHTITVEDHQIGAQTTVANVELSLCKPSHRAVRLVAGVTSLHACSGVKLGDDYALQSIHERNSGGAPQQLVKAAAIFESTLRLDFACRQLAQARSGSKRSVSS